MEVVPDDFGLIEDRLHHYVDAGCDLIFTTGGTGLTPDDVTPEATRAVIDREAPGLRRGDARRGRASTRRSGILTRGVSGIAGRTLIVNFPGSPKAIDQLFGVLAPTLDARGADAARRLVAPWPRADAPRRRAARARAGLRRAGRAGGRDAGAAARGHARRVRRQRRRQDDAAARARDAAAPARAATARVLGRELPREGWAVRGRIGLLAHEPLLYRDLTARENLRFHARLHDVAPARAGELLEAVGMARRADEPVRALSRGMAQRVAICRARAARAGAAAARRAARQPRPGRGRSGRAADRPRERRRARADLPRRRAGAGRGRPRARPARRAGPRCWPRPARSTPATCEGCTGEARGRRARAQGPAGRAADRRGGAGDAAVQRLDVRALPLRARPPARSRATWPPACCG